MPDFESGGWGFESSWARQNDLTRLIPNISLFFIVFETFSNKLMFSEFSEAYISGFLRSSKSDCSAKIPLVLQNYKTGLYS